MKPLCLVVLLILLSRAWAQTDRPNVLFISVDDLNDMTGYAGNTEVFSPNMDRLAEQGVWFSRGYCAYPVCGPSRASVMTGVYFHQLNSPKLQINDDMAQQRASAMGSRLLHEAFGDQGYKTMAVGKILHRHVPKNSVDLSGGRGKWNQNRDEKGNKVEVNWVSDKTLTDWGVYSGKEHEMSDSIAAAWAVKRLKEDHQSPFFLMVGFLRPHVPWHTPKRYFDLYDPDKLTRPPYRADDLEDVPEEGKELINDGYPRTEWAIEQNHWGEILQAYYASITFVDHKIGMVLDALEASPYADNTLVVLWSDHGYHMGEKNTFQKHTLWDRSARVPIIIKLPKSMEGHMTPGRSDRVVSLVDLYPTLLDLCGLPENPVLVGRSLAPLVKDPGAPWNHPAFTFRKTAKAVTLGDQRYIEYSDGSQEFYDLSEDPNEWTNQAANPTYRKPLELLQGQFDAYRVFDKK